jgi:hypothetical protein
LAPDHTRWIPARSHLFLPVKVLSRVFRGKFVSGLRQLHGAGKLTLSGALSHLQSQKTFAAWLRSLYRSDWVVYSKPPFGGPEHVLHYLGTYIHRIAISNHRLVDLADGMVAFRWRDSAHNNKKRLAQLPVEEFLRRFLLHVLPCGFVRIRHFGFYAHRRRATLVPACARLLGAMQTPITGEVQQTNSSPDDTLWKCPHCQGPMVLIERLTAQQVRLRSPPNAKSCS